MRAADERTVFLLTIVFCLTCAAWGCVSKQQKPKFMGCFQDSKSNRDLPQTVSGQEPMTLEVCEKRCRSLGRKYFGVQGGNECWCGDSYGKYGKVDDSGCSRNCMGQAEEVCGGIVTNSVYEILY